MQWPFLWDHTRVLLVCFHVPHKAFQEPMLLATFASGLLSNMQLRGRETSTDHPAARIGILTDDGKVRFAVFEDLIYSSILINVPEPFCKFTPT